ncbi:glyoxalase [Listeria floridensis FSL S10-1187]|uniref:Glyoxalase n=1 Tax=Listeria floridensis FSL S10-1187 TaxID=1265817 RepID=A0ABN0RGY7_9LIST|nr:VOC family protein [Listeria floridensis]EUJ33184.1 glyoxalase [Listeria floridensis FSL S10-1187]
MKIEHMALWTKDLNRMKEFYERYFNASASERYDNKQKGFSSYFLTFESGSRLEIMTRTDITTSPAGEHFGYAHLAFSVGSKEQVDQVTETFRKDGFEIAGEPRTTGDGYYESVVRDSDGNLIEITI